MNDSIFKNPHDEARAQIIWGESPAEVTDWLVREGLTEDQAEVLIKEIEKERALEIRRSGLRSIKTGVLIFFGGTLLLIITSIARHSVMTIDMIFVGLTLFGLYKIVTGILRFLSGRASGSLTEMD